MKSHLRVVPGASPSHKTVVRSTLVVMAATFASSLLGFGREVVNARFYGAWWEMDSFLAAATIPTILFGLFNGALLSALVPTFTDYVARGEEEEACRLASTVFNGLLIALTVLAAVGWFLTPYYVPIVAHGFHGHQLEVTIDMTRWLTPSIIATSLAGVCSAMLNAHQRFSASAVQGIAINVATISTVLILNNRMGIYALVLGTALGLVAQLLVQLPAILRYRLYRPVLDLKHPGLNKIKAMLGPIVVGSAAGQLSVFFDRYFASTLSPGYLAGMNYATKLVGFPQQIFAAAIATVIFPLLASQFASANRVGVKRSVVMGLRMVNFITIPSVFGLTTLARPIVAALFQRGQFGETATDLCAGLLPFAAIGLVGTAADVVLTRCCFACKETRLTVAISMFAVLLNIALSVLWLPTLGARGLLLANAVSQWTQAVFLFALVWHLVNGLDWKTILISTLRIGFCSLVMVAALLWISSLGVHVGPSFLSRASYLAGELAIGAMVFIAAARLTGVEELSIAATLILRKFQNRIPTPPESREVPIA
ncbi:MAG: murein biosynthesis integral membrane protein MurJ [Vulcanimicrobiaceae bacterium]